MRENRKNNRVDISLTARWPGSATNHDVRISDLSENGVYIDTLADVTVGETLAIKILLPDGEWFEPDAVVVHHSRFGFGIRFVDLDEKQRAQIRQLLRKNEPDAPDSGR
jgi:hypothetical protein